MLSGESGVTDGMKVAEIRVIEHRFTDKLVHFLLKKDYLTIIHISIMENGQ